MKEQEAPTPLRDAAIPVYREAAMYAFEAGELSAYRTSMQANMDCKEAIEQTINDYYGNNRLATESAVKSILEKFSPERVAYVLANTIQQKDHDGRISRDCKEWAKGMDASPDHATQLIIDSVNPWGWSVFSPKSSSGRPLSVRYRSRHRLNRANRLCRRRLPKLRLPKSRNRRHR